MKKHFLVLNHAVLNHIGFLFSRFVNTGCFGYATIIPILDIISLEEFSSRTNGNIITPL